MYICIYPFLYVSNKLLDIKPTTHYLHSVLLGFQKPCKTQSILRTNNKCSEGAANILDNNINKHIQNHAIQFQMHQPNNHPTQQSINPTSHQKNNNHTPFPATSPKPKYRPSALCCSAGHMISSAWPVQTPGQPQSHHGVCPGGMQACQHMLSKNLAVHTYQNTGTLSQCFCHACPHLEAEQCCHEVSQAQP